MATITSNGTGGGDWSVGSSWIGGIAPIASDSVIISVSDIINYNTDIIHTQPIEVNGTLRGSGTRLLILANVAMTVNAGGSITNTGGIFTIQISSATNQISSYLNLLGSVGNPVIILGESITNYIVFTSGGFLRGGKSIVRYTNFNFIGTSGVDTTFVAAFTFTSGASGITDTFEITHCNFGADCGRIQTTAVANTINFIIEDNVFLSTGQNLSATIANTAISTGTRSIQRNWFGGSLGNPSNGGQWFDVTLKYNVIRRRFNSLDAVNYPIANFGWNLVQNHLTTGVIVNFATTFVEPNYLHIHNDSNIINNIRGLIVPTVRDLVIGGWIIEPGNTDNTGDVLLVPLASTPRVYGYEYCLLLTNKNGIHSGQFVSLIGNANISIKIEHCTWFVDNTPNNIECGSISYGETYAGHAGIITLIKSNIAVGDSNGFLFSRRNLGTVSDGCFAVNITNNGKFELTGTGYGDASNVTPTVPMFSTGTPGLNDIVADPTFVDSTRRISTWAIERGYVSSGVDYQTAITAAYEALKTDISTRIEDLITWVRNGYAPTNPVFKNTAHDGTDIGAVPVILGGGGGEVEIGPLRSSIGIHIGIGV